MHNPFIQMLCSLEGKFHIRQLLSTLAPPLDLDQHEGHYPIHAFGHLLTSISPSQLISTYPLSIHPPFIYHHLPSFSLIPPSQLSSLLLASILSWCHKTSSWLLYSNWGHHIPWRSCLVHPSYLIILQSIHLHIPIFHLHLLNSWLSHHLLHLSIN